MCLLLSPSCFYFTVGMEPVGKNPYDEVIDLLIMAQVIWKTAYALYGSMEWHLERGSYQPVTGPGFIACRGALPWWRVFPAAGAHRAVAEFARFTTT